MRPFVIAAAFAPLLLAGAAHAAAPASDAPPRAERCFSVEDVQRYHGHGDQTLILRTRTDRYYAVGFVGSCPNVLRPDANVVLSSRGASSLICNANDLRATITASGFPQTCAVSSLKGLSPAEVAALPDKDRP
ncbi:hypothetical protein BH09PSE2_BH09PSE2_08610 [soil metagenome]